MGRVCLPALRYFPPSHQSINISSGTGKNDSPIQSAKPRDLTSLHSSSITKHHRKWWRPTESLDQYWPLYLAATRNSPLWHFVTQVTLLQRHYSGRHAVRKDTSHMTYRQASPTSKTNKVTLSYFLLENFGKHCANATELGWPCGLMCRSAAFRWLGLRVRMPPRSLMFAVTVVRRAGRCLCDMSITRPEEAYHVYVSLNVIRCNSNPLHLHWVGRRCQTKKERKKLNTP